MYTELQATVKRINLHPFIHWTAVLQLRSYIQEDEGIHTDVHFECLWVCLGRLLSWGTPLTPALCKRSTKESHMTTLLSHFMIMAMSRNTLCIILVYRHNNGKNPGQSQTNKDYLGQSIGLYSCVNALTYTNGYSSLAGWQDWAGYHSGNWYATHKIFSDGAMWNQPYYKYDPGQTYAVQPVRFDSQERIKDCHRVDMTGATCRYGWNQSGIGVSNHLQCMYPTHACRCQ